jgi:hypothetical protein
MTAVMLIGQSRIDAGDNLVILAPVWPNIGRPDNGDTSRSAATDPGRPHRQTRGLSLGAASTPPLRLC